MGTIVFAILGGVIGYSIGRCMFHNSEYEKTMSSFYSYIKSRKAQRKSEYKAATANVEEAKDA